MHGTIEFSPRFNATIDELFDSSPLLNDIVTGAILFLCRGTIHPRLVPSSTDPYGSAKRQESEKKPLSRPLLHRNPYHGGQRARNYRERPFPPFDRPSTDNYDDDEYSWRGNEKCRGKMESVDKIVRNVKKRLKKARNCLYASKRFDRIVFQRWFGYSCDGMSSSVRGGGR